MIARERSDAEQGAVLRRWFEENVLPTFADRMLPFDLSAARAPRDLSGSRARAFDDALIAAVPEATDMAVVTRNTKHF